MDCCVESAKILDTGLCGYRVDQNHHSINCDRLLVALLDVWDGVGLIFNSELIGGWISVGLGIRQGS